MLSSRGAQSVENAQYLTVAGPVLAAYVPPVSQWLEQEGRSCAPAIWLVGRLSYEMSKTATIYIETKITTCFRHVRGMSPDVDDPSWLRCHNHAPT